MIEEDFRDLRAAARESAVGRWISSTLAGVSQAFEDAVSVRVVKDRATRIRHERPEVRVRWVALTLAIAAAIALALSRVIPPYLSTFIPISGFVAALVIFAIAAAMPALVVTQWDGSGLRRVTRWLLD